MRYCNKGDVMQYLQRQNNTSAENNTSCECGFTSHVAKGLQSHQLTCELIKRRLNNQSIPLIEANSKIRMWIVTQWYTGTVIKHTPTSHIPNLYQIHFRSKGDQPLPYNLEKYNFRLLTNKLNINHQHQNQNQSNVGGNKPKKHKKQKHHHHKKHHKKHKKHNKNHKKRKRACISDDEVK
eukprot:UN12527